MPTIYKISERNEWKLHLPSTNYVFMSHYTTSVLPNRMIGRVFGNISYTVTTQLNDPKTFYKYSNVGNGGVSYGAGVNLYNWVGVSGYVSSNRGVGTNVQLTPWVTAGAEVSVFDGISVSAGIIFDNTTHEISVSIGWGTITAACLLASLPIPGARIAAGLVLLFDIFM